MAKREGFQEVVDSPEPTDPTVKIIGGIVIGIVALMVLLGTFFSVAVGEVGVVFNKAAGSTKVKTQGIHFKVPLLEEVTKFDIKTQSIVLREECSSKDLQLVNMTTILNLHLRSENVNEVYTKIGADWTAKIVNPIAYEVAKSTLSGYNVEEIIGKRDQIRQQIEKELRSRYDSYNVVLETVSLANIDFSKEYNKIVEQKQIEQQRILVVENQKKQAEFTKAKMILEAEGEAQKNNLMRQSATEQIIALEWIKKWNGTLPATMLGDGKNLMVNIKSAKGE